VPDLIVDAEIVPLAGDDHVIVPVIAHLAGPPGVAGHHGAGDGQSVPLALLAAKAAAHSPHFDPHRMHGNVERMGDLVLDLGRVLGGAVHDHVAVVLRQDEARLAFEVEMLLPAHGERPFEAVGAAAMAALMSPLVQMRGPSSKRLFAASASSMVRIGVVAS
jgi:hypothetical protein